MGQTLGFHLVRTRGHAVARRAALRLRMLAYDPFLQETLISEHGVIPATLSEVLSQSDFVSMHAPALGCTTCSAKATPPNEKGAIFINTGRGATGGRGSLIKALQEGWIAHTPRSTCWKRPPSHNNPLLGMENVT